MFTLQRLAASTFPFHFCICFSFSFQEKSKTKKKKKKKDKEVKSEEFYSESNGTSAYLVNEINYHRHEICVGAEATV